MQVFGLGRPWGPCARATCGSALWTSGPLRPNRTGAWAIVKGIQRGEVPWVLIGVVAGLLVLLSGIGYFARRKLRAAEREAGVEPEDDP